MVNQTSLLCSFRKIDVYQSLRFLITETTWAWSFPCAADYKPIDKCLPGPATHFALTTPMSQNISLNFEK